MIIQANGQLYEAGRDKIFIYFTEDDIKAILTDLPNGGVYENMPNHFNANIDKDRAFFRKAAKALMSS